MINVTIPKTDQRSEKVMKQLFVAWTFMRRPESMQPHFGYDVSFLSFAFPNRYLRPLEYLLKGWKTLVLLLRERPQVVWIQVAPTPLLYAVQLYKTLFNRRLTIIADCHNSMFRAPWIRFPGALALLNLCDLVLVHNTWVYERATAIGVTAVRLHILETKPATLDCQVIQEQVTFPKPWILLPCSFNADEPIDVVLSTARLIPEITFVVTGNTARAKGLHDLSNIPSNIKLVGFLPKTEFDMLLCATDAILGLTILDGVQLSVANEAVGTIKPMVLSNTELLKELFYKGAVYVDPLNPQSIAQGCKEVISRKIELTEEVSQLKIERNKRWLGQADKVDKILHSWLEP